MTEKSMTETQRTYYVVTTRRPPRVYPRTRSRAAVEELYDQCPPRSCPGIWEVSQFPNRAWKIDRFVSEFDTLRDAVAAIRFEVSP